MRKEATIKVKEIHEQTWQERMLEKRREEEKFKEEMERKFEMSEFNKEIREEVFRMAWEAGHANGYHAVEFYYNKYSNLVKLCWDCWKI